MFQTYISIDSLAKPDRLWRPRLVAATFFTVLCFIIVSLNTEIQIPFASKIRGLPAADKIAHFGVYGSLAMAVNFALGMAHLKLTGRTFDNRYFQIGSIAVLIFSLGEEFSQQFFPSRTMDVWDAACNIAGVAFFTWMTVRLMSRSR